MVVALVDCHPSHLCTKLLEAYYGRNEDIRLMKQSQGLLCKEAATCTLTAHLNVIRDH